MTSPALIESLVADLRPVDPRQPARRIVVGLAVGAIVSALAMLTWIGPRADLAHAFSTASFWIKFAYTLGLALAAGLALQRLSRPAGVARQATLCALAVLAALLVVAGVQLLMAAPAARMPLVMGTSANVCPWRIAVLSLPIFAGAVWAVRGLAPTRLGFAGAMLGLAAGAFGAWVYSFSCGETAAPFVALWYTLGIAAVALLGAASGRKLLRW